VLKTGSPSTPYKPLLPIENETRPPSTRKSNNRKSKGSVSFSNVDENIPPTRK